MKEEIIISGRSNLFIDPHLHIWEWQIPVYLFLGGVAAGLLIFSALFYLRGKESTMPVVIKYAPLLVPVLISIGLIALLLDLKHPLYFWRLYTTVKFDSPMSWGAWTLMAVMILSIIWGLTFLKDFFNNLNAKHPGIYARFHWTEKLIFRFGIINFLEKTGIKNRRLLAWSLIILGVILGIYTGILLSAFNARPLWNTSILGPLFLVSGLSTAAATLMLLSKDMKEKKLFSQIDLVLISTELFLIIHLFMGFLASSSVQIEAASLFLGGDFTVTFWVFVVGIGLVIPAFLEILELRGYHIHTSIPAIMILLGGLIFRFVMIDAGQITRYLY